MSIKPSAVGRFSVALVDGKTGKTVASEVFFRGSTRQRRASRAAMYEALKSRPLQKRMQRVSIRPKAIKDLLDAATARAELVGRAGHKRIYISV